MHPRAILIDNTVPAGQPLRADLIVHTDCDARQIIKQCLEVVLKEPQPMLDACMFSARTDRLVERIIRTRCPERNAVILAKPYNGLLVQYHLGYRRKLDLFEGFCRALGHRIKATCPVQYITKQIQPDRTRLARRVNVNNTAAHRIIASVHDRRALGEPHAHQKLAQSVLVDAVADASLERSVP